MLSNVYSGFNKRLEARKQQTRALFERLAGEREKWLARNKYYYDECYNYWKFLIPEKMRVLELGCGTGQLLNVLRPLRGVGIDFSEKMIQISRSQFPDLEFVVADMEDISTLGGLQGPFDFIIMQDTLGYLVDCQATFTGLHSFCNADTRVIISYSNWFWEPILKFAELLGMKMPNAKLNWVSSEDIIGLLHLADFDVIKRDWRQLVPLKLFGLGTIINRYIGSLPVIRRLCLSHYIVARSLRAVSRVPLSATVLIPCRNERENVKNAILRIPRFCDDMEYIFVEGHSHDDTFSECLRVRDAYPDYDIKVFQQPGKGKGDAVRKGFAEARGEVLMILDGDLTMPPEELPKYYQVLISGKGEFVNGSRMVYPLENQAMRFLNYWANSIFSIIFTWLLNQRFTDTLCGTKVLTKKHYRRIAEGRSFFGDFDPFGDFDLIFGATKQNLKIIEVPIRYSSRVYGETQISRFQHGWLLLRMVIFAYRRLKAF